MSFAYRETGDAVWKYETTEPHTHAYHPKNRPILGRSSLYVPEFFTCSELSVSFRPSYAWNGSNAVVDTVHDMLASAVHDAECQAMELGIYQASWRNWWRAAREYRRNCIDEGMNPARAYVRSTGILIGGGNGYKWRKFARKLTRE